MYITQIKDGKIVFFLKCRDDVQLEQLRVIEDFPALEKREGHIPTLMYSDENGAYWDYKQTKASKEIPLSETY